MSKFKKLVGELQKEGKSEDSARKIAYSIGAKKYGKAGMAKKAAAGRKKSYRVGGKTPVEPLTEKERAIIAAERARLKASQRKVQRARDEMKKYSGTSDVPIENPGYSNFIKTRDAVNDSLKRNASPMQKELNDRIDIAPGMANLNRMAYGNSRVYDNSGAEELMQTKRVPTVPSFKNKFKKYKTVLLDADDFIEQSEKDAEGRYRRGLKRDPNYSYKLKKGGKVKSKKYKRK